jgi:hypothetical protein
VCQEGTINGDEVIESSWSQQTVVIVAVVVVVVVVVVVDDDAAAAAVVIVVVVLRAGAGATLMVLCCSRENLKKTSVNSSPTNIRSISNSRAFELGGHVRVCKLNNRLRVVSSLEIITHRQHEIQAVALNAVAVVFGEE